MTVTSSTQAQTPVVPAGSGTQGNPYRISQLGHLVWMSSNVTSSSGVYYTLQNDIDASATAGWNSGAGFAPIGIVYSTPFLGIFNGNGKVISNLSINRPSEDGVGLFRYLGYYAVVKNLGLAGVLVTGTNQVGSLVGINGAGSTVSNCYATGSVTGGGECVGGLVGENDNGRVIGCYATSAVAGDYIVGGLVGNDVGTVSGCYATGSVTGRSTVGGLVGDIAGGAVVSECYAMGAVTGRDYVGGLVGYSSGNVSGSHATGAVTGRGPVGGLVGHSGNWLWDCYATGSVIGNDSVGGLVGENVNAMSGSYATGSVTGVDAINIAGVVDVACQLGGLVGANYGPVSECYATGAVDGSGGWRWFGGLMGYNNDTVSNCYATGSVIGNEAVGGLVGENDYGTVSRSYWDTETSGQATSAGGTGKITVQMKQQVTFVGWDFANVWRITENVTYPLFVTPPTNPQVQTSDGSFGVRTNRFGFNITGTSGLVIVVEACTNLAHPIWSPVGTNTLTGGSSYFSDPKWTNYPGRFYRLRSP
jgi:hypothetical protein